MSILVLPLQLFAIVLTVLLFVFGVRRLLGVRLSPLRTLVAGVIAFVLAPLIINAVGTSVVKHHGRATTVLPALWFVMLSVAIALLIGMLLLVVAEALVPSGTLPGPLYVIRSARRRLSRGRRYMQIAAILVRRGMLPYLRGARRAELASSEGRRQLALSLRRTLGREQVPAGGEDLADGACALGESWRGSRASGAAQRNPATTQVP